MSCTINYNTQSIDQWESKFSTITRSNILQSYTYARARCPIAKQRARWGLIQIDGRDAGLVQIFEVGFLGLHALMLDRGPLWFDGFGNAMHVKRFFEEFNRQFPKRFGRKRRILPEIEDGPSAQKMITQWGFNRLPSNGYETFWVDLTQDHETLRANLKSNWRNKLNKAEKSGIEIEWDVEGTHLPWLLGIYATDKALRDYGGPSADFLKSYVPMLAQQNNLLLGRAMKDGVPIAFSLFALHGRSATYLVGWSSEDGRETAAHQLCLWMAMMALKNRGIKELDLGGVNDETAAGIKTFKEGVGGRFMRTVGHYV